MLSTAWLHILLIPAILVVFVYNYIPMAGIIIAFQKYEIGKGISAFWESDFIGLGNFRRAMSGNEFIPALMNTLTIASLK